MLLSHTVLSELYREKLVTKDEVKRMKGEEEDLSNRVVLVHWEKMAAITCCRVSSHVSMWRGFFRSEVDVRCAAGVACRRMSTREAPVLRKLNVEFSDVRVIMSQAEFAV